MNPLEAIFGQQTPPTKLKVYAPNGDTKEVTAYLGIREHQHFQQLTELFLQHEDGTIEVLSKKVVIKNLETGNVCYNPRTCPHYLNKRPFITESEKSWLQENSHWPAVLELWDNPVENGEERDGLHPA